MRTNKNYLVVASGSSIYFSYVFTNYVETHNYTIVGTIYAIEVTLSTVIISVDFDVYQYTIPGFYSICKINPSSMASDFMLFWDDIDAVVAVVRN